MNAINPPADYVSSPLTKGGKEGVFHVSSSPDKTPPSPPDKGGKGGLNTLIVLNYVFYSNILIYNSYKIINYILYIIITV